MKRISFYLLDAFTDKAFQGNPAGVFLDEGCVLADDEMRHLAGEVSLESAFVSSISGGAEADFRLRYFTGVTEVPFCGHDTVAATVALALSGRIAGDGQVHYATPVGVLAVSAHTAADGSISATLHQNAPTFGKILTGGEKTEVADALGCSPLALSPDDLPVQVVSTGTPWLLAPVADQAAVDNAPADYVAITQLSRQYETFGIYVFAIEREENNEISIWSRCFAPVAGLNEDPVTGSASGALGCYLAEQGILRVSETAAAAAAFTSRQGFAGGRGGTAQVSVRRENGVYRADVSGTAVLVAEGTFTFP